MTDPAITLGQRMRQRRWQELRIRQRDLAAAAALSPGYLSELEHDDARATEPTLRRLALALGLEECALVTQAVTEGRLTTRFGHRATRAVDAAIVPPPSVPPPPPRVAPRKRWLTTAEAANLIGVTEGAVR